MHLNEETKDGIVILCMVILVFVMGLALGRMDKDIQMPVDILPDTLQIPIEILVEIPKTDEIEVTATMYHPVAEQCDNTPDVTADGSKIPDVFDCSDLNWIAVSQDLLWFNDGPFHYGDTVKIEDADFKNGIYVVHDAMNRRAKMKIDFLESVGAPEYKLKNVSLIQIKS